MVNIFKSKPKNTKSKISRQNDHFHDLCYAIDFTILKHELEREPFLQFDEGIEKTVEWYLNNQTWMDNVTSGNYMQYYQSMYKEL